jgi:hypothetical protein
MCQARGLPAASLVQGVNEKSKVQSSEPPDLVFRETRTSLAYPEGAGGRTGTLYDLIARLEYLPNRYAICSRKGRKR